MKASFNVDSFYNTWPLRQHNIQHNICIFIQVHIPSTYSIRDFNVFIKLIYCSCYFLGLSGSSSRQNQSNSSHLIASYVTLRRGLGSSAAKVSKDNKLDKLRVCLFLKACFFVSPVLILCSITCLFLVFNMICLQTDTTEKSLTTTFSQFCHSVCGPSVWAVETDFLHLYPGKLIFLLHLLPAILLFCLVLCPFCFLPLLICLIGWVQIFECVQSNWYIWQCGWKKAFLIRSS